MEKRKMIKSRLGALTFKIPESTRGGLDILMLKRYQRSERAFLSCIGEMAVKGVSTPKLKKLAESFFGYPISIPTVVGLCKSLSDDLGTWRQKRLDEAYPYIFVNTCCVKIRLNRCVIDQEALMVAGVNEFSKRRLLEFMLVDSDDDVVWHNLFDRLKKRGLHGVRLIVSGDHSGIVKAARHCFKDAKWQRCQAGFINDALTKLSERKEYQTLTDIIKEIFCADDIKKALIYKKNLLSHFCDANPDLAGWFGENINDCLTVFSFPASHQKRLKTTNMLMPLLKEIRKRRRLIEIFPCRESAERMIGALVIDKDEEWLTRRDYLNMAVWTL